MLRKLNFTDRARIPKGGIQIALRRHSDGVLAFDSGISLDPIALPPHARVYVEAYYRSSYMRFDFGTVAELVPPIDRRLLDIDSDSVVRFRVKIVDNASGQHRIVAVADDITVAAKQPRSSSRTSLLPVNFSDLGDEVWRINFEPNGPVLDLNNRINGIEQMAKSDWRFFSLVYPAVVRAILTNVLLIEAYQTVDDASEWWNRWIRWGTDLTGESPVAGEDERSGWIEDVVAAFCAKHQVVDRLNTPEVEA